MKTIIPALVLLLLSACESKTDYEVFMEDCIKTISEIRGGSLSEGSKQRIKLVCMDKYGGKK